MTLFLNRLYRYIIFILDNYRQTFKLSTYTEEVENLILKLLLMNGLLIRIIFVI